MKPIGAANLHLSSEAGGKFPQSCWKLPSLQKWGQIQEELPARAGVRQRGSSWIWTLKALFSGLSTLFFSLFHLPADLTHAWVGHTLPSPSSQSTPGEPLKRLFLRVCVFPPVVKAELLMTQMVVIVAALPSGSLACLPASASKRPSASSHQL